MSQKLIYIATPLTHKRHRLVYSPNFINFIVNNNIKIFFTFDPESNQAKKIIPRNYFDPIYKNITYLSPIKNDKLLSILNDFDGLLFLSEMESLGLPIIEACINKLPIIAPKMDYITELIGHEYKYLFDSSNDFENNVNSLINTLNIFLNDHSNQVYELPKLKKDLISIEKFADLILKMI